MINIKDVDKEILLKIECEETFLNFSTVNKYFSSLYDENMFKKRMSLQFPNANNDKNLSFKRLYLYNLFLCKKLKETFQFNFKTGDPEKYICIS